ncbi:uncharacterized protein LOC133892132 [Phragmites australis]|uniref:uncharacterized protein LOC133892132 n=1 Tax=Phragmites australis TaxID=29695 RepID=UPI002D78B694|nr:uncharacterized protein LOC133892132 [Phragmites australis]
MVGYVRSTGEVGQARSRVVARPGSPRADTGGVARLRSVAGKEGSPDGTASTTEEGGGMGRARSLTNDDLEELKGYMDLGFGFSYHEIPELCSTLPTLKLCYSMSQRFLDEHQQLSKTEETLAVPASPSQPIATNGKISSPRDSPDEVKVRLKYWAQAVACTVKLCR